MRMRVTRVPRCGRISTKPSAWSLLKASETGKRETPSRSQISMLVDVRAGRQIALDDRVTQHGMNALRRAATAGERQTRQKSIVRGFHDRSWHSSMLAPTSAVSSVASTAALTAGPAGRPETPSRGTRHDHRPETAPHASSPCQGQCGRGGRFIDIGMALPDGVVARQRVPKGHKVAVVPIGEGEPIVKFGQIIGFASRAHRSGHPMSTPRTAPSTPSTATTPSPRTPSRRRSCLSRCRRPSRAIGAPTARPVPATTSRS